MFLENGLRGTLRAWDRLIFTLTGNGGVVGWAIRGRQLVRFVENDNKIFFHTRHPADLADIFPIARIIAAAANLQISSERRPTPDRVEYTLR